MSKRSDKPDLLIIVCGLIVIATILILGLRAEKRAVDRAIAQNQETLQGGNMNNLYFDADSIQGFTDAPPRCPKCGSMKTERKYRPFAPGPLDRLSITDFEGEWLEVHCSDCRYAWPQHTKDWLSKKVTETVKNET